MGATVDIGVYKETSERGHGGVALGQVYEKKFDHSPSLVGIAPHRRISVRKLPTQPGEDLVPDPRPDLFDASIQSGAIVGPQSPRHPSSEEIVKTNGGENLGRAEVLVSVGPAPRCDGVCNFFEAGAIVECFTNPKAILDVATQGRTEGEPTLGYRKRHFTESLEHRRLTYTRATR
jgi:hypothetical protein